MKKLVPWLAAPSSTAALIQVISLYIVNQYAFKVQGNGKIGICASIS